MSKSKLTKRQTEVLELIQSQIEEKGAPPTRAEIAEIMGFRSPNAAEDHLRALEKKGAISIYKGTSRGIKIIESKEGLPVVGKVAAGQPIMSEGHISSHYKVDKNLFSPGANYLLKVQGNSMEKIGILDGDLLVVYSTNQARNGQIVVARINNEVTVKRFKRDEINNTVQLLPENDSYSPINVDPSKDDILIEGIGVGVIRSGL